MKNKLKIKETYIKVPLNNVGGILQLIAICCVFCYNSKKNK